MYKDNLLFAIYHQQYSLSKSIFPSNNNFYFCVFALNRFIFLLSHCRKAMATYTLQ